MQNDAIAKIHTESLLQIDMTGELDDIKLGLAFYPIDKNNDIIGLYADSKSIYLSKRISNKWYTIWTK